MHSFFGIISTNSSTSEFNFDALSARFPTAFGKATAFKEASLHLMGDVRRSAMPNGSTLYCCGEFYHTNAAADVQKQLEQLHHRVEQIGLPAAAAELNGRFMLCYLDGAGRNAQILTDHLAIQQVFYHQGPGFVLFGSEIKFLLQHPRCPKTIDWQNALRRSIPFEVLDGEKNYHAWFKDIFLLEEATALNIDLKTGASEKRAYWNPYDDANTGADERSAQQVMDAYMELLEDAVRIRIQDGDMAFSFLSGGLDSSILCAIAARIKPTETFSIITQTTLLEETTQLCDRLAKDLHFDNTQFVVPYHRLATDIDLWKKRVWRAESPFAHTDSLTKTLLHDAIRRLHPHISYNLTGTGSDQLNGGLARWIVEDADSQEESWKNMIGKVSEAELRHHLPERLHALWGARNFLQRDFVESISGRSIERNPMRYYIKSNVHINHFVLVWDENRAAYAHRHSARYPFLDPRFLGFMANIPERLHAELFYDKQILRKPAARYLPDYILNKPKAPANTGMYDRRLAIYQSLVNPRKLDLLEEALGPLNEPHPVIDKIALITELERLTLKPEHKPWQYLLNVINLGLLEKLHLQDEASMGYEDALQTMMETVTELNPATTNRIRQNLDIVPEEALLRRPIQFAEGCSLVTEHPGGKVYLNKNEILAYEIDEEELAWRSFLFAIDNTRSTAQVLADLNLDFEQIKDYFYLCLKEAILQTGPSES
ncbi:MAG: asparagine synthase-related protein [Saprospiraceae bacterium]